MSLNNDIIAKIVSQADIPIDTYLAFKHIGVIPKKLKINTNLKTKLDIICIKRVKQFKYYNEIIFPYSVPLYNNTIYSDIKLKIRVNADNTVRILLTQKRIEHIIDDYGLDQTEFAEYKKGVHIIYSFAIYIMNITIPNINLLRRQYYHICDGTPADGFEDSDDELIL